MTKQKAQPRKSLTTSTTSTNALILYDCCRPDNVLHTNVELLIVYHKDHKTAEIIARKFDSTTDEDKRLYINYVDLYERIEFQLYSLYETNFKQQQADFKQSNPTTSLPKNLIQPTPFEDCSFNIRKENINDYVLQRLNVVLIDTDSHITVEMHENTYVPKSSVPNPLSSLIVEKPEALHQFEIKHHRQHSIAEIILKDMIEKANLDALMSEDPQTSDKIPATRHDSVMSNYSTVGNCGDSVKSIVSVQAQNDFLKIMKKSSTQPVINYPIKSNHSRDVGHRSFDNSNGTGGSNASDINKNNYNNNNNGNISNLSAVAQDYKVDTSNNHPVNNINSTILTIESSNSNATSPVKNVVIDAPAAENTLPPHVITRQPTTSTFKAMHHNINMKSYKEHINGNSAGGSTGNSAVGSTAASRRDSVNSSPERHGNSNENIAANMDINNDILKALQSVSDDPQFSNYDNHSNNNSNNNNSSNSNNINNNNSSNNSNNGHSSEVNSLATTLEERLATIHLSSSTPVLPSLPLTTMEKSPTKSTVEPTTFDHTSPRFGEFRSAHTFNSSRPGSRPTSGHNRSFSAVDLLTRFSPRLDPNSGTTGGSSGVSGSGHHRSLSHGSSNALPPLGKMISPRRDSLTGASHVEILAAIMEQNTNHNLVHGISDNDGNNNGSGNSNNANIINSRRNSHITSNNSGAFIQSNSNNGSGKSNKDQNIGTTGGVVVHNNGSRRNSFDNLNNKLRAQTPPLRSFALNDGTLNNISAVNATDLNHQLQNKIGIVTQNHSTDHPEGYLPSLDSTNMANFANTTGIVTNKSSKKYNSNGNLSALGVSESGKNSRNPSPLPPIANSTSTCNNLNLLGIHNGQNSSNSSESAAGSYDLTTASSTKATTQTTTLKSSGNSSSDFLALNSSNGVEVKRRSSLRDSLQRHGISDASPREELPLYVAGGGTEQESKKGPTWSSKADPAPKHVIVDRLPAHQL